MPHFLYLSVRPLTHPTVMTHGLRELQETMHLKRPEIWLLRPARVSSACPCRPTTPGDDSRIQTFGRHSMNQQRAELESLALIACDDWGAFRACVRLTDQMADIPGMPGKCLYTEMTHKLVTRTSKLRVTLSSSNTDRGMPRTGEMFRCY